MGAYFVEFFQQDRDERQYKITRAKADEAWVAISELDNASLPDGLSPEMREWQLQALKGTLGDFETELDDYDELHDATLIEATGIGEFPTALIRARIARGLTQRELADRLGLARAGRWSGPRGKGSSSRC